MGVFARWTDIVFDLVKFFTFSEVLRNASQHFRHLQSITYYSQNAIYIYSYKKVTKEPYNVVGAKAVFRACYQMWGR